MEDNIKCCANCICRSCFNKMWDGGLDDCFTCEYCIDADRHKEQKSECGKHN